MWESFKTFKKNGGDDAFSGTTMAVRCYESHPVLKLGKGKLYGGAARHPFKDADVFVVLQDGDGAGRQSDPWDAPKVVEIQYAIRDMDVPKNVSRFKKLVTYLCNQLHEGKTVHVGCIGGHGRTGMVLSAIVAEMLEEKDAIQYVRKHYCKKVVESTEQVQFLMKHYGVSSVVATKGSGNEIGFVRGQSMYDFPPDPIERGARMVPASTRKVIREDAPKAATKSFGPMASGRSLWKSKKK